jgi:hypothetical protein
VEAVQSSRQMTSLYVPEDACTVLVRPHTRTQAERVLTGVDHRFDREDHTGLEHAHCLILWSASGRSHERRRKHTGAGERRTGVVRNVGGAVEKLSDAVSAERAHHREPFVRCKDTSLADTHAAVPSRGGAGEGRTVRRDELGDRVADRADHKVRFDCRQKPVRGVAYKSRLHAPAHRSGWKP